MEKIIYDDKYEKEINDIIRLNPKNYVRVLKSRGFKGRCPNRKYLLDYIYRCTPMLDDSRHSLKTRIYWTVHRMADFPTCANDRHSVHRLDVDNVLNMEKGYPKYCDSKCRHEAPAYFESVKAGMMRKHGVENAF